MSKVEKIKAEIKRLKKSLPWGSCASQLSMECNCKKEAYNEVLSYIDSLEEEPISNDLEEAATKYARKQLSNPDYPTYNDEYEMECAFEAGAQWQKDTFIEKTCEFFGEHLWKYINVKNANCDTFINIDGDKLKEDFKKYIKGE